MNKFFLLAALVSTVSLLPACAVSAEDPGADPVEETAGKAAAGEPSEDTGTASEAYAAPPAEQLCCSNIDGWGSVLYYQSWAGYGWVTTTTYYHQGGSCPGTSGSCSRVNPS